MATCLPARIQVSSGLHSRTVCSGAESFIVKLRPHPHSTPASYQALGPVHHILQASAVGVQETASSSPPLEGLEILQGKTGQSPTVCRHAPAEGRVLSAEAAGSGGMMETELRLVGETGVCSELGLWSATVGWVFQVRGTDGAETGRKEYVPGPSGSNTSGSVSCKLMTLGKRRNPSEPVSQPYSAAGNETYVGGLRGG